MLNYAQARNEIRAFFYTKWVDAITNGVPDEGIAPLNLTTNGSATVYIPKVYWPNVEIGAKEDTGKHWCRFVTKDVDTSQKSLTGGRQAGAGTIFTTVGIIIAQLFYSKSSYQTVDEDALNFITANIFRSTRTTGGVVFRNSTVQELEPEETHFRANVTAEYEYDSIKL